MTVIQKKFRCQTLWISKILKSIISVIFTVTGYLRYIAARTRPDVLVPPERKTFDETIAPDNPFKNQWWEAILKECQVLTNFGSFRVAEEQTDRTMKTKWVFKVTMKNDMTYKFKARLVVCGYSQVYGIDYFETYSPPTPISTIFMLMHIWCKFEPFHSHL